MTQSWWVYAKNLNDYMDPIKHSPDTITDTWWDDMIIRTMWMLAANRNHPVLAGDPYPSLIQNVIYGFSPDIFAVAQQLKGQPIVCPPELRVFWFAYNLTEEKGQFLCEQDFKAVCNDVIARREKAS